MVKYERARLSFFLKRHALSDAKLTKFELVQKLKHELDSIQPEFLIDVLKYCHRLILVVVCAEHHILLYNIEGLSALC